MKKKSVVLDLTNAFTKDILRENCIMRETLQSIADGEWQVNSSAQQMAKNVLKSLEKGKR